MCVYECAGYFDNEELELAIRVFKEETPVRCMPKSLFVVLALVEFRVQVRIGKILVWKLWVNSRNVWRGCLRDRSLNGWDLEC